MSDAEVICNFMEIKPELPFYRTRSERSFGSWWVMTGGQWGWEWWTCELTLDLLWEVEERLITLGYRAHIDNALSQEAWRDATAASLWHATAAQKIAALASVIKEEVKHNA